MAAVTSSLHISVEWSAKVASCSCRSSVGCFMQSRRDSCSVHPCNTVFHLWSPEPLESDREGEIPHSQAWKWSVSLPPRFFCPECHLSKGSQDVIQLFVQVHKPWESGFERLPLEVWLIKPPWRLSCWGDRVKQSLEVTFFPYPVSFSPFHSPNVRLFLFTFSPFPEAALRSIQFLFCLILHLCICLSSCEPQPL